MVDKSTYENWQKKIKALFSHLERGEYKTYTKKKCIVAAYLPKDLNAWKRGDFRRLTPKTKWELFHLGTGRAESVSYGYDREEKCFMMAATDTGGLTNARLCHDGSSKIKYAFDSLLLLTPEERQNTSQVGEYLYDAWLRLSGRQQFYENDVTKSNFLKWVESAMMYECQFVFIEHEGETMKVMPAHKVFEKIGRYYVRNFSKSRDDETYATQPSNRELRNLYLAFSEEKNYLTPNINQRNVNNEYSQTPTNHD